MASFSRKQLPRAFAAFGPVLGLSAVLGPIVGGFIISANLAGRPDQRALRRHVRLLRGPARRPDPRIRPRSHSVARFSAPTGGNTAEALQVAQIVIQLNDFLALAVTAS